MSAKTSLDFSSMLPSELLDWCMENILDPGPGAFDILDYAFRVVNACHERLRPVLNFSPICIQAVDSYSEGDLWAVTYDTLLFTEADYEWYEKAQIASGRYITTSRDSSLAYAILQASAKLTADLNRRAGRCG